MKLMEPQHIIPPQPQPIIPPVTSQSPPSRKVRTIILLLLFLIIIGGCVYYFVMSQANNQKITSASIPLSPTSITRPTQTLNQPGITSFQLEQTDEEILSYFNSLRLDLSVPEQTTEIFVSIDTSSGNINKVTSSLPTSPLGKITNFQPEANGYYPPFYNATLIGQRLYTVFNGKSNSYIGYISDNEAKAVIINLSIFSGANISTYNDFHPSPDSNLMSIVIINKSNLMTSADGLLLINKNLDNPHIIYYEDQKDHITPLGPRNGSPISEFLPHIKIINWSKYGNSIYIAWELGGLGPPPLVGLGKVTLDGKIETMGLSESLTPIAISTDERYILAAHSFFGLYDPVLVDRTNKTSTDLPYKVLVDTLRNKLGKFTGAGRDDAIQDAYFGDNDKAVYYNIWIRTGTEQSKTFLYKVDLSNLSSATEVN